MSGAQTFLLGVKALREEYADALEDYARLRESATKTTSRLSGVSVSGTKDPHKDGVVIALADADERMMKMKERLRAETLLAESLILKVPNPLHCDLLRLRYLNGLEWRHVQRALEQTREQTVTARTIYNYHNAALDAAETVWEKGLYDTRYREIKKRYPLA